MTLDLTAIEARLKAATPGPWELWTGCSWRRFGRAGTLETVCEPTTHPIDGHPDLFFRNGGSNGPDAALIAAAPGDIAALLDALRAHRALLQEVAARHLFFTRG